MPVLYFANASSGKIRDAMADRRLGAILAPGGGSTPPPNAIMCADNGCFGKGWPGEEKWWDWLTKLDASRLKFAVAPDVVGDAAATIARSAPWLPKIRELGIPAAFVAQDGLEDLEVPWDTFDVLFVGGSTAWKIGPAARRIVADAKAHGKWVHMGRVNSHRRLSYAAHIGCDSADGTYLVFGPDVNLPKMLGWLRRLDQEAELFNGYDQDSPV